MDVYDDPLTPILVVPVGGCCADGCCEGKACSDRSCTDIGGLRPYGAAIGMLYLELLESEEEIRWGTGFWFGRGVEIFAGTVDDGGTCCCAGCAEN